MKRALLAAGALALLPQEPCALSINEAVVPGARDPAAFLARLGANRTAQGPQTEDEETQDLFVRRCTVVMSVGNSAFLPDDAMDKFCRTTDAVVDCRQTLTRRMREVHKQGGSPQGFCKAAYDWFQAKYGMFCPMQCMKLQCVSTCRWLEDKKKLEATKDQIDAATKSESENLNKIKEDEDKVKELETAMKKKEFDASQAGVKAQRADRDFQDAEKNRKLCVEDQDKVQLNVNRLEQDISQNEANIQDLEDKIQKDQFAVDKMAQRKQFLTEDIAKIEEKIAEQAVVVDEAEKLVQKEADSMKKQEDVKEETQKAFQEEDQKVQKQTQETQKWIDAVAEAEKKLKEAKANKDPQDSIDLLESLVTKQKGRRDDAKKELWDMERARNKQEIKVNQAEEIIKGLTEALAKRSATMEAEEKKMQALNADRTARKKEVAEKEKTLAVTEKSVADNQAKVKEEMADLKKAQATVTQERKRLKEEQETTDKATKSANKASEAQQDADQKKIEAEGEAKIAKLAYETKDKEVKAAQAQWNEKNKELLKKADRQKTDMRSLEGRVPEIVKQHGLGLIAYLLEA